MGVHFFLDKCTYFNLVKTLLSSLSQQIDTHCEGPAHKYGFSSSFQALLLAAEIKDLCLGHVALQLKLG